VLEDGEYSIHTISDTKIEFSKSQTTCEFCDRTKYCSIYDELGCVEAAKLIHKPVFNTYLKKLINDKK